MNYFLAISLGSLPSLIWLLYYLRQDIHPEPKRLILKVFIWGALVSLPAVLIEIGLQRIIDLLNFSNHLGPFFYYFLDIAATEEILKYEVVKLGISKNPEFDEPVDAMIYMISSALGFALVENILSLFSLQQPFLVEKTISTIISRFWGSTFLHTLASGTVGYFLGLSFFSQNKKYKNLIPLGLTIAILFHGFYDYSIVRMPNQWKLISLSGLFFLILVEFHRIKTKKMTNKK